MIDAPGLDTGAADGELTSSAVMAWATAKAIEFLKTRAWFPWLTCDTERANRFVSWAAAAAMSLGLAFTFDAATGGFELKGTLGGLATGILHAVRQVMFQEIAYKQFIRKKAEG
jgi:hypothetical protein